MGWYFKCQGEGAAIALIPAVHRSGDGVETASLQVITRENSWWLDYEGQDCRIQPGEPNIRLGNHRFDPSGIWLDVEREGLTLRGRLTFGAFTPLKSDIMGPFRLLPRMECRHGVVSMGHRVDGLLTLNGEALNFHNGLSYVEMDRGRSFPSSYLWAQCLWQEGGLHSVMLAIAAIPLGPVVFPGCICAVVHGGREYRMATYLGAKILRWSRTGGTIRQGKLRLCVEVLEEQAAPLRAPLAGEMGRTVHESLCATVRVRFWRGDTLLFDHQDGCAGFEYADDRTRSRH